MSANHRRIVASLLFLTCATNARAFESDDFNRVNLDPDRWTFVNPLGDGWVAMAGTGSPDASLTLTLPDGPSHDPWQVNRAPRVMRPIGNIDLDIHVRFASIPTARYQMQGIVAEQDADNWIRFDVLNDGISQRIFAGVTTNGASSALFNDAIEDGAAEFMRVVRTGDEWTLQIAGADTLFTSAGSFVHTLVVNAAGVFVANHQISGMPSPGFTAIVDYVFDTAAPIVPEDGVAEPDTLPPLVHGVSHAMAASELIVSWHTDEPAFGSVAYGTSMAYELGTIPSDSLATTHEVALGGLTPGETYHYMICSEDPGNRESCTDDIEVLFDPSGPDISIWYGLEQPFGSVGRPQPWVNVLGHVGDPDGVASLSYTLNAGESVVLSIGPDGRRLENEGDFNVDIGTIDLVAGANTVVVTAVDGAGTESTATVTLDYTGGTTWPLPYAFDWGTLSSDEDIQDVAQVVDGKWQLDGGGVRTTEPGYDRLIAVGDSAWTDYEFVVPVTLASTPGSFGTGVLLRWNGHTNTPVTCGQPLCGYLPLGGILWLRSGRLEIYGNDGIIYDSAAMSVETGVTYWLKGRVETDPGGSIYSAKAWAEGQPEPPSWQVVGQGDLDDPLQGSLLLISHQADATFGPLSVTELEPPTNIPPIANDDVVHVAPGDSVDAVVLANDMDIDGTLDPASVTVASGPLHGTASVDTTSGVITYVHDGSATAADALTYTVRDDEGAESVPATLTVVVSSDPPPTLASDDFNRCVLNDERWAVVNPLGDGEAATEGAGSGDAHLTLSLPAGTAHDAWGPGGLNQTVRVMQTTIDTDFQAEVRWNAEPTVGFDDQGLLVEQDADTWLRFDVYHNNTQLKLFVGRTLAGTNTTLLNATIPVGSATHLRVARTGNVFTTSTSSDGVTWDEQHMFVQPLSVGQVGVYAGNPVDALAFTSEVDYFLVSTDPLSDEDGAVNEIDVEVTGEGEVLLDPSEAVYACDEVVELTAVPEPGWTFAGWSGDLEGVENPAQLTVTGRMSVMATFDAPVGVDGPSSVSAFALLGISPNPSSGPTTIRFQTPTVSGAHVDIVDVAGRLVCRLSSQGPLEAGVHEFTWDGTTTAGQATAPGVYFAIVRTASHSGATRLLRLE